MNEQTRYEVALFDREGKVVRVLGYTQRRTKSVLLGYIAGVGHTREALAKMLTEAELDQEWRYDSDACRIRFAGTNIGVGLTGATKYQRENEA